MPTYSIFTYQFQRIKKGAELTLDFVDTPSVSCTDEDWNRRQELFGSLFGGKDFGGNEIVFRRGDTVFIHEVLYNKYGIIVMKFANPKKRKIINIQLKEAEIDDYPWCYAAVGIHPDHASTYTDADIEEIRKLAAHPKAVAIGEIGLDFYYGTDDRVEQQELFRRHCN